MSHKPQIEPRKDLAEKTSQDPNSGIRGLAQEGTVDLVTNQPHPEDPDSTAQFQSDSAASGSGQQEQTLDQEGAATPSEDKDGDMTVEPGQITAPGNPDQTMGFVEEKTGEKEPDQNEPTGDFTEKIDRTVAQDKKPETNEGTVRQTGEVPAGATVKGEKSKGKAGALPGRVGNYVIMGELGRGGMGVVYLAQQMGLNRTVALKMVLAGSHASVEQLARFRIEAEAVALLQHPNIVQVYEVGEEDGCPFFSLEYIDGQSLVKIIDGAPQPFREAARLVQSLAEAMHLAHQRGIIHRDLKPANILLTKDGIPKITDFGLAKRFEDQEEEHTRSGAIMGTPSYMAPEQAQGKTKEAGPPADIYSLGAILYDMLTGRPPFRGTTLLDTLNQVKSMEPVSPARLQPGVPRDLETICLKALEKEPAKRYASAGELAEDLRRFQTGEPILARPTPWWERSLKWVKRRPALASLISVSTLAAVTLLTLGGLWLDSERRAAEDREAAARDREKFQVEQAKAAKEREAAAKERERLQAEQAKKEKALRQQIERNYQRAEKNFRHAREAVVFMLSRVGQDQLAHVPQMARIRKELLEKALALYRRFQDEKSRDPAIRWETARAQQRVADIYQMLGQPLLAEKAYGEALGLFSTLAKDYPDQRDYRKDWAGGLNNFGNLMKDLKKTRQAETMFRQALKLRQELAGAIPSAPQAIQELAETINNLAIVLQILGKGEDAEPAYRQARDLLKKLVDKEQPSPQRKRGMEELARTLNNLGELYVALGKSGPAEKCYQEARDRLQALVKEAGEVPEYRRQLGLAWNHLGDLWRDSRPKEALEAYHKALALRKKLAEDFSSFPDYREDWAMTQAGLANLFQALGKQKQADDAQEQAMNIRLKSAADFPHLPELRFKVACTLNNYGVALQTKRRPADADSNYQKALNIFSRLLDEFPNVPSYRQELASVYLNRAVLFQQTGQTPEAEKAGLKALETWRDLAKRFDKVPTYQEGLAKAHLTLGYLQLIGKQLPRAEKSYAEAADLYARLAQNDAGNPDYRRQLAISQANRGDVLRALKRFPEAEKSWNASRKLYHRLASDFPEVPGYRQELARHLNQWSSYLIDNRRLDEADKALEEAMDLQKKLLAQLPGRADLGQEAALALGNRGILLARRDQKKQARQSFRQGIDLMEKWVRDRSASEGTQPAFIHDLIQLYQNLIQLDQALNRPLEVEKSLFRILDLREKLVQALPEAAAFRFELCRDLNDIAGRLLQREKFAEAKPYLDKAVNHLQAVLKTKAQDPLARQWLYASYFKLASAEVNLGNHRQTAAIVAKTMPLTPAKGDLTPQAAALLARCASLTLKDKKLSTNEAKSLAASYAGQAMKLLRQAVSRGFRDVRFLKKTEEFQSLGERPDFQEMIRTLESLNKLSRPQTWFAPKSRWSW